MKIGEVPTPFLLHSSNSSFCACPFVGRAFFLGPFTACRPGLPLRSRSSSPGLVSSFGGRRALGVKERGSSVTATHSVLFLPYQNSPKLKSKPNPFPIHRLVTVPRRGANASSPIHLSAPPPLLRSPEAPLAVWATHLNSECSTKGGVGLLLPPLLPAVRWCLGSVVPVWVGVSGVLLCRFFLFPPCFLCPVWYNIGR